MGSPHVAVEHANAGDTGAADSAPVCLKEEEEPHIQQSGQQQQQQQQQEQEPEQRPQPEPREELKQRPTQQELQEEPQQEPQKKATETSQQGPSSQPREGDHAGDSIKAEAGAEAGGEAAGREAAGSEEQSKGGNAEGEGAAPADGDLKREAAQEADPTVKKEEEKPPAEVEVKPRKRRRTGWSDPPTQPAPPSPSVPRRTAAEIEADILERTAKAAIQAPVADRAARHQLCRVYVGSLDYTLADSDIRQVFAVFGPIVNIDMPREGGRSKGFCFVEYANPESAAAALTTMSNFQLRGRTIKVGRPTSLSATACGIPMLGSTSVLSGSGALGGLGALTNGSSTAEAGQMAALMLQQQQQQAALEGGQIHRVYVGNVPYDFCSEDVKKIFEVFGPLLNCQLIPSIEKPGTHRGYGFLEFGDGEQAKLAIETMNGFSVAGKTLRVNYATAGHSARALQQQHHQQQPQTGDVSPSAAAAAGAAAAAAALSSLT